MNAHEFENNLLAKSGKELETLSRYIEKRGEMLSSMERLRVHRAKLDPITPEYGSMWKMYNKWLILNLESFRRHIASVKAWNLIIPNLIDGENPDESLIDTLIRDYVQPQIHYLIDAPQAINNQINQAVLRLNMIWENPDSHWEEMQKKVEGLKGGIYEKTKETAFMCNEWEQLKTALDSFHSNESATYFQSLHGDKYHDIASPPFVIFSVPWQETPAFGIKTFGFREDTLDIDRLLDCAIIQLNNAHGAYKRFHDYAARLYAECTSRFGGILINEE